MSQTLQNQITYAKSMNGIVELSDGAGTTISNGTINTDNIDVDNFNATNFTSNNIIVDYMQILRDSNPTVNTALGFTVDVGLLVQNMIFQDTTRLYQIWNDTATNPIFQVDVSHNYITTETEHLYITSNFITIDAPQITFQNAGVNFTNSYLAIERLSTAGVIAALGDVINLNYLVQNLNYDNVLRRFYIYNDSGSNTPVVIDTSNNAITLTTSTFLISAGQLSVQATYYTIQDSIVQFPNSTVTFNSFLPTTSLTTGFADNTFITRIYADSRYPRLASQNAFTNLNTFNTNLPRSTLTTATLDAQFVTKGIADGFYGRLIVANTFTGTNQFNRGILPCTTWSTTNIQVGGLNTMGNRQTTSLDNVGIGVDTLKGDADPTGYIYSTGSRNTAVGNYALMQQGSGFDCVAIGFEAMKLTGLERIYGAGVSPSNCIAIGSGSQKVNLYGYDNISIGKNSLNNVGSGTSNIILGNNAGNGLGNVGSNVVIGSGAMPTSVDNGITCIGAGALGAAVGTCGTGTFIGFNAGRNNSNGNSNTFVGANAGLNNTGGANNQCFGVYAGRLSLSTGNFMTAIGYDSKCVQSNEFSIGGESYTERAELTLPNKVRLNCCQTVGSVATYNVSWRSNENIIVTTATTNFINLPIATYTDGLHVGATFNIIRSSGSTSNMYIVANGTETINYEGVSVVSFPIDSWVQSVSVTCIGFTAGADMWAVCRYNNRVSLATDSKKLQTLTNSSNVNYPMCFTTIATTGYNNVYANASMYYNPSTSEMTVPNLTVSGILTGTATSSTFATLTNRAGSSTTYSMIFSNGLGSILGALGGVTDLTYNPVTKLLNMGPTGSAQGTIQSYISKSTVYQYYEASDLITTATTLGAYYSYIPFTMKTAAAYSITLPVIDSASVGTQITFKRIGGSLQALSITAQGNQPTYLSGNARGTTTASNILVSASQGSSTIVATETGDVGAGTFTNVAGSVTITVVTQSSGTLTIGHIINLNGNVRFITAYLTGLGGASNTTYTVNTAIAGANTGAAYSTSLTYGWCVTTVA